MVHSWTSSTLEGHLRDAGGSGRTAVKLEKETAENKEKKVKFLCRGELYRYFVSLNW